MPLLDAPLCNTTWLTMLQINIAGLEAGNHHMVLEPSAEALDLSAETFRDLRVHAHLFSQPNRILVAFTAEADAALTCDRTLEPFVQPVRGDYSVLFAAPGTATDAEEHEEVRELLPTDQEIDITDAVRDTLLLAVPQRKIAPGAEDEEIQTAFGAPSGDETLADPRWAALRALKDGDAS